MSEQDKTPAEMAVPRGDPVQIERVANGFIVREAFIGIGSGRMTGPPLVFNDLAGNGSLLDWLATHFESDADRARRLEMARFQAEVHKAALPTPVPTLMPDSTPFVGFPPITGCNPAPFDGCLLRGCVTGLGPNGFATTDAGKPA